MPTYSKSEFCAKSADILKTLENGEEVIITQRGKPWAKLMPVRKLSEYQKENTLSMSSLREAIGRRLPDLEYEDFQAVKTIWGPDDPRANKNVADRTR